MDIEDFLTRPEAEEGVKFPLKTVEGEETEHYLIVLGSESAPWREVKRKALEKAVKKLRGQAVETGETDFDVNSSVFLGRLIKSWSFPHRCDFESASKFLYDAPYIMDQLDLFVSDQSNFRKKKLSNSSSIVENGSKPTKEIPKG